MRKILITGAAGFIGSELAKALSNKNKYELVLVDNLSYGYLDNLKNHKVINNFHLMDIRSKEFLEMVPEFDCIFHFAGISSLPECEANPQLALDVNTLSVANILQSLRSAKKSTKFILASTSAVYENTNSVLLDEEDECKPNLVYAQSKYFAESLAQSYQENYGIETIICRFFNVYGPHQDYRRIHPPFTSYLVKEILAQRSPTLYNLGDERRDYIYISDLLMYLNFLMECENSSNIGIVNLCSGSAYSAIEICETLESIIGTKINFEVGDPNNFWIKYTSLFDKLNNLNLSRIKQEVHKNAVGNSKKIRDLTNYVPKTDLRTGLKMIIEYQASQNE
jgi:nucleoside-diphosphate-sugar epimerase